MTEKAVMSRFYDRVAAGDLGVIDQVLAEDFIEHEAIAPSPDREGVRQLFTMLAAAFPDMRFGVEHMVQEDDLVMAYGTVEGTHEGEFMGVPATGKRVSVPFADVVRFRDGLGVEHWGVFDSGMMMQQLAPAPAPR
jgi:steroid delta-isomerase-like uncharacterized protein